MNRLSIILFFQLISLWAASEVNFVRCTFVSNASSEVTIAWNQLSGQDAYVLLDTLPNSFGGTKEYVDHSSRIKGMNTFFVRLTNLEAHRRYYFSIYDSEGNSREYYFTTCPDDSSPISIIAGGDARDNSHIRILANKMVAKLKPHLVLFNGDFTRSNSSSQWQDWFQDWEYSIHESGRITPLIVSRGNHEKSNRVIRQLFDVPSSKIYYNTIIGGELLNIISLNSEIRKKGAQTQFLDSTLASNKHKTWQIVQYHRPVRPHVGHKKENKGEYKYFVPLFEANSNVKLCLENDSHTCKTTWPILMSTELGSEDGFMRDDDLGITYVGEGCWGAPLREPDDRKYWTRDCEAVNQFNWIFVTRKKIEVRKVLYENTDMVLDLTEETRFEIPEKLALWTPQNGSIIEIIK